MAKHLVIQSLYNLKDISDSNNSSFKQVGLIDSAHVNDIHRGSFSTKKQNTTESLNSKEIDRSTDDVKPDIKRLSNDILSNCDAINSKISPYIKRDLNDMEHIENNFSIMRKDKLKHEIPLQLQSTFICQIKEETMYCQSCSYSDVDFGRLKFHTFREHPTGAAVVANTFYETNCNLHDIKLFCIKETCTFSTAQCSLYEEHLMSCCLLHETLSEDEKERLKSTVKFILDFHSKHSLNTVPGFLDYISNFNTTFTHKDDKVQTRQDLEYNNSLSMQTGSVSDLDVSVNCSNPSTNIENAVSLFSTPVILITTQNTDKLEEQERKHEQLSKLDPCNGTFASTNKGKTTLFQLADDQDVSENVALEIDVAGSPIDIKSLKEDVKGDKMIEMKLHNGEHCTKDLHVPNKQCGKMKRITTESHPVDHSDDLHNDVMRMNRSHFYSGMISDLHCDVKVNPGKQSFLINENVKKSGHNNMDFIQHKRNHTNDKPLKCNVCGKTFAYSSHLIVHMKSHTGEKPFKCNECGKTFGYNSHLNDHVRTHTGEKPFQCNECGKMFSRNGHLIRHRITHTGEKAFKCSECGKTFGQSSDLVRHMRTHTGEKPFICNECGKTFSQSSNLSEHSRVHTGEKPFKCIECGKTFSQGGDLIKHRRIHTGERPFKCNECGKTFSQRSHLIDHWRTHTGEKPFKCNKCGKAYSQGGDLIKHRRKHI